MGLHKDKEELTLSELLNISSNVVRVSETRYCHFFIFFFTASGVGEDT